MNLCKRLLFWVSFQSYEVCIIARNPIKSFVKSNVLINNNLVRKTPHSLRLCICMKKLKNITYLTSKLHYLKNAATKNQILFFCFLWGGGRYIPLMLCSFWKRNWLPIFTPSSPPPPKKCSV